MARLRSLLYAIFLIVTVIPYAFACVLWAPLPLHLRYKLTVGWPRLAIWGARVICGIRWQVKGWENLPDGPAVILSSTSPRGKRCSFPPTCRAKSASSTRRNCTWCRSSAGAWRCCA